MVLSLFHDNPASDSDYQIFAKDRVLDRLAGVTRTVQQQGLDALNPSRDDLVSVCTRKTSGGRAWAPCCAPLSLAWQLRDHPEWPATILSELDTIRREIKTAHGARIRFLVLIANGTTAEEIALYNAVGILKRSPRVYVADSADPVKLKCILDDMVRRSGLRLADALRSTLVVGFTKGAAPDVALLQLERLVAVFERNKVDATPNVHTIAAVGSPMYRFGVEHGLGQIALGPDSEDATGGAGPLTRCSLYPLGLARFDLERWMEGAYLSPSQIQDAWRLAAFLNTQANEGKDKLTLVLPKPWLGVAAWTRLAVEQGLAGCRSPVLRTVVENRIKLANYRSPRESNQDRAFLAVKVRGFPREAPDKIGMLRRAGYPLATVTFSKSVQLSSFMHFVQFLVLGLSYLKRTGRDRPRTSGSRTSLARAVFDEARKAGGIEKTEAWQTMAGSAARRRHRTCVSLYASAPGNESSIEDTDGPTLYATLLKRSLKQKKTEYAELLFFGDARYCAKGRAALKALERSSERLFRSRLKLPAYAAEGPDGVTISPRRCFTTLVVGEKSERLSGASPGALYLQAQFLATWQWLEKRGATVVVITLKDLEEQTLGSLEDFFRQAGAALRTIKL